MSGVKRKRFDEDDEEIVDDGFIGFGDDAKTASSGNMDSGRKRRPLLLNRLIFPWMKVGPRIDNRAPPLVRLHNEILRFCDMIAPTKEELDNRTSALDNITKIVAKLWPEAEVKVFGSQMTQIITPTSDLDLAILNVPIPDGNDMLEVLTKLAVKLREALPLSYLEVIYSARVPIIKLDIETTGVSVDICLNNDQGIRTGSLVIEYVKEYPPLKPLMLVLKTFLTQRKLNETYTGGMGSFLLCSTIVSFLQMKHKVAKYTETQFNYNLGSLLLEYLHHYGVAFNYFTTGIQIAGEGKFFPKHLWSEISGEVATNANQNRPGILCLQNPDVADHDVGKSSYMMQKIRRTFDQALQLLTVALNDYNEFSYLCYFIRGDDPVLVQRIKAL